MNSAAPSIPAGERVDRWLWCVRLFKTRAQATAACRAEAVLMDGRPVKPAREVRAGETVVVRQGPVTRTLRVEGLPKARLGPKQVPACCTELTPAEEWAKAKTSRVEQVLARDPGAGRPTKRDRRQLDRLFGRG